MTLDIRNVSVEARERRIVDGLSMHLERGELVGLIGPNGAGKSTLLKAIIGTWRPASGEILIDGTRIERLSGAERARALAYLPQERRVEWQLPARAVVMLGRFPHRRGFGPPAAECEAAVERALIEVDAVELAARSLASLSGGERARILLARSLAVEAPLLLADEPIAELDPYHQIHVMEILKRRTRKGAGILAVLHDLTLAARFMDRLILVDEGRVVAEGAPRVVLSKRNLEEVYRVSPLEGEQAADTFVLPWRRTPRAGDNAS